MNQPLTIRELIKELSQYPQDLVPTMAIKVEVTTEATTHANRVIGQEQKFTRSAFLHARIYGVQGQTGPNAQVSISGS